MRATILSLLILFCLIACKKSDTKDIEILSYFEAVKNDTIWVSTYSWANFSKTEKSFNISGTKRDSKYYQEERLFFRFYLSDILKSDTINIFFSERLYIIGGDVGTDYYYIDSTVYNMINVTSIDTIGKQISGKFSVALKSDKLKSGQAETIKFREGKFKLSYKEID